MAVALTSLLQGLDDFKYEEVVGSDKFLYGAVIVDGLGFITTLVVGILGFAVFHFPLPLSISLVSVSGLIIGSWAFLIGSILLDAYVLHPKRYVS